MFVIIICRLKEGGGRGDAFIEYVVADVCSGIEEGIVYAYNY